MRGVEMRGVDMSGGRYERGRNEESWERGLREGLLATMGVELGCIEWVCVSERVC